MTGIALRALLLALLVVTGAPLRAAERVALVIGIAGYTAAPPLANPGNDAQAVAAALSAQGFAVSLVRDPGRMALAEALKAFRAEADAAEVALVYYSGHGIEVAGANYLIPADAALADERDVEDETVSLDWTFRQIEGARLLGMVVLDACRNNPFADRLARANPRRSIGRGLERVAPETPNRLVVYAAAAGRTTPDGPPGSTSPFTAAFVEALAGPPEEVRLLMGAVKDGVRRRLGRDADPYVYENLGGTKIILNPARQVEAVAAPAAAPPTAPAPAPPPVPADPNAAARADWDAISGSEEVAVFEAFIDDHPRARAFVALARERIGRLRTKTNTVRSAPATAGVDPPDTDFSPSFDCAKATRADEIAICQSEDLSQLDRKMADLFNQIKTNLGEVDRTKFIQEQRQFLRLRNTCGNQIRCLVDMYKGRLYQMSR